MKLQIKILFLIGALAVLPAGCTADKDYSAEKFKDLDTEMTFFQNGLTVPLIRNTVEIYADSIISNLMDSSARNMFKVTTDGKYEINVKGHENLDSLIKSLKLDDAFKIEPVNFESEFSNEFGDLDPEKFKSEELSFEGSAKMPDLSNVSDIKISPLNETITADSGIKDTDFDIDVNVNPFQRTQTIFSKESIRTAGEISPLDEVQLPNSSITLDVAAESIPAFDIPSSIKNINSIKLKGNSRVSVKLSVVNSVLTEGTVTPALVADLSDLLSFTGGSGSIDLSSMVLSQANGFSATKDFPIANVNISKLDQIKSVAVNGSVQISGAKSTKAKCAACTGDLGINISFSFPDFGVESVVCEIKDFSTTVGKTVDIAIDDITLPKEVKSVDFISFTESSNLTMQLSATNLDRISGVSMKAGSVKVTFPEGLVVSGEHVSNNVLSLSNVDLNTVCNEVVKVSRINLPAPKDGKISYSPEIKVEAECTASGTVNTADLKKLSSDISVSTKISGNLNVSDFQATINEYKADVPEIEGVLSFSVPEKAASYGPITLYPDGNPCLSLKMNIPDLGGLSVSAGNGIKVHLPYFIVLGTTDPDLEYDKTSNILTIKTLKNKTYNIPVEKMVASAEKTETGYKVLGKYALEGGICVAPGIVNKSTINKISLAELSFAATVPSIKAAKLSVEELSFDVNENADFEILKSKDIPDQLVSLGEVLLKDVKAKLGIELEGLPSIGSGSKFMIDLKAELPAFIKPSTIYIKGEIKDGMFYNQPIPVEGFNLSEFDFQKMKSSGESLKGSAKITGRLYADNPQVDLKTISGTVSGKFKAGISDSENRIKIKNISAKIDYQIDTTFSIGMVDFTRKLNDVHFDLPDMTAIVGMRTNLAIPISGKAKIVPVKDNKVIEGISITKDLAFPYCPPPATTDTVTNTLSIGMNDILNSKCDSLRIYASLNTDKTRDCFIEPEKKYSLRLGYDLSLPLQPKSDFKLEYADTLNLEESLKGLEDVISRSSIGITGNIESTFPIGLRVKVSFLNYDKEKGAYSLLPLREVETDLLSPNSESYVEIITGPEKPGTAIPEITHLRFSLVLSTDGKAIGPKSYLKIKNIALTLPEGATVNPATMK